MSGNSIAAQSIEATPEVIAAKASPVSAASQTEALMQLIERVASNPEIDLDRFERLIGMRNEIEDRHTKAAYAAAMARAQSKMAPVIKTLRNDQTRSTYADLAAIAEGITPIYTTEGLSVTFSTIANEPECQGIRAEVMHEAGHARAYDFQIPLDGAGLRGNANKTATHAYGSTLTYGRRYAKLLIFDIATKDDRDGNQPEAAAPEDEIAKIEALIKETGADLGWICAHHSVEVLADMTAAQRRETINGLMARKRGQRMKAKAAGRAAGSVETKGGDNV